MRVPWDDKERVTCPNCHGDGQSHGHPDDVPGVAACQRCNANGWIYAPDRLLSENAVVEALEGLDSPASCDENCRQEHEWVEGIRDAIAIIRSLPEAGEPTQLEPG